MSTSSSEDEELGTTYQPPISASRRAPVSYSDDDDSDSENERKPTVNVKHADTSESSDDDDRLRVIAPAAASTFGLQQRSSAGYDDSEDEDSDSFEEAYVVKRAPPPPPATSTPSDSTQPDILHAPGASVDRSVSDSDSDDEVKKVDHVVPSNRSENDEVSDEDESFSDAEPVMPQIASAPPPTQHRESDSEEEVLDEPAPLELPKPADPKDASDDDSDAVVPIAPRDFRAESSEEEEEETEAPRPIAPSIQPTVSYSSDEEEEDDVPPKPIAPVGFTRGASYSEEEEEEEDPAPAILPMTTQAESESEEEELDLPPPRARSPIASHSNSDSDSDDEITAPPARRNSDSSSSTGSKGMRKLPPSAFDPNSDSEVDAPAHRTPIKPTTTTTTILGQDSDSSGDEGALVAAAVSGTHDSERSDDEDSAKSQGSLADEKDGERTDVPEVAATSEEESPEISVAAQADPIPDGSHILGSHPPLRQTSDDEKPLEEISSEISAVEKKKKKKKKKETVEKGSEVTEGSVSEPVAEASVDPVPEKKKKKKKIPAEPAPAEPTDEPATQTETHNLPPIDVPPSEPLDSQSGVETAASVETEKKKKKKKKKKTTKGSVERVGSGGSEEGEEAGVQDTNGPSADPLAILTEKIDEIPPGENPTDENPTVTENVEGADGEKKKKKKKKKVADTAPETAVGNGGAAAEEGVEKPASHADEETGEIKKKKKKKKKISAEETSMENPTGDAPTTEKKKKKKKKTPTEAKDPSLDYVLPPDWAAYTSEDDGKIFYYNTKTGTSQWEPPTPVVQEHEVYLEKTSEKTAPLSVEKQAGPEERRNEYATEMRKYVETRQMKMMTQYAGLHAAASPPAPSTKLALPSLKNIQAFVSKSDPEEEKAKRLREKKSIADLFFKDKTPVVKQPTICVCVIEILGMHLWLGPDKLCYVRDIVPGGLVELSGLVSLGDVVIEVDGSSVLLPTLEEVAQLVVNCGYQAFLEKRDFVLSFSRGAPSAETSVIVMVPLPSAAQQQINKRNEASRPAITQAAPK